jgi:hypothetical protein
MGKRKRRNKKGKIKCRYCGRYIDAAKTKTHECNAKGESKSYWRAWKESNPDLAVKYPTFEAYDKALIDGDIIDKFNPHGPYDFDPDANGQPAMDTEQASEPGPGDMGADVQGNALESGYHDAGNDDQPIDAGGAISAELGLIQTAPEETPAMIGPDSVSQDQHEKPPPSSMLETLKEGAGDIVQGSLDTLRFTHKNRAWMFFVELQHSLKMYVFNADDRGSRFKLSKRDKKLISESYQATFGDSPLLKLKVEGTGEWANHAIVADWEVYGDFYINNIWGAIDRGKFIYNKIQERKKKKEQEAIDANLSQG